MRNDYITRLVQICDECFDKVSRTVNVTADSGTAMIRDIMKIF